MPSSIPTNHHICPDKISSKKNLKFSLAYLRWLLLTKGRNLSRFSAENKCLLYLFWKVVKSVDNDRGTNLLSIV